MTQEYDDIVDECPCERQGRCHVCLGTGVIVTRVKITKQPAAAETERDVIATLPD